jgi:CHAD domain-containing protein
MDTAREHLTEYFLSLQKKCVKSAAEIKKEFDGKEIHNFRVCIKKINALTDYLVFLRKDFHSDNKITLHLYKAAGRLRSLYLIKRELKRLNLYDKEWKKFLKEEFSKEKENYKDVYKKFRKNFKHDFKTDKSRVYFTLDETINLEENSKQYINIQQEEVIKLSGDVIKGEHDIHLLRKNLKEFGYNYFALSEAFYLLTDKSLLSSVEKLNKLLGKWHDKIVFKKYVSKQTKIESSQRIAEQTSSEINLFHNAIINELKAFIL